MSSVANDDFGAVLDRAGHSRQPGSVDSVFGQTEQQPFDGLADRGPIARFPRCQKAFADQGLDILGTNLDTRNTRNVETLSDLPICGGYVVIRYDNIL